MICSVKAGAAFFDVAISTFRVRHLPYVQSFMDGRVRKLVVQSLRDRLNRLIEEARQAGELIGPLQSRPKISKAERASAVTGPHDTQISGAVGRSARRGPSP